MEIVNVLNGNSDFADVLRLFHIRKRCPQPSTHEGNLYFDCL